VRVAGDLIREDDLQASVDGRLPPERAELLKTYLTAHPEERDRLSQYAEQRKALRAAFAAPSSGPASAGLRVADLLAARRRRRHRELAQVAAAIALLVLGGLGGWTAHEIVPRLTASASATLATTVFDDAIAAHRTFSVETRHPVEVGASEEAHLVQWLSKRLGRRLIAPDLRPLGFQLMGGRLLPAESGPAALFMYEDGKGIRLSCYYLSVASADETEFKFREQNGISAFYWVDDGLAYAIAANTPRDVLLKIAELVYQQNSSDSAKPKLPSTPGKPS
jgi:anti-sigma factor RsiW